MKCSLGLGLLFCAGNVLAMQNYCEKGYKPVSDKDLVLDLGNLNKEFIVFQNNTSTPPTITNILHQINICDPLPVPEKATEGDYCPKGTFICRKSYIVREDSKLEMLYTVEPVAVDSKLDAQFKPVDAERDATKSGYQYLLTLNGGKYKDKDLSASVTLECDESQSRTEKAKDPSILSFNNNVLNLHWKTVFACATKAGEKVPDNKDGEKEPPKEGGDVKKGMSGIGIFFTMVFVLAGVYFIGGAFYNYKMYNARGLDLLPHRDFWFDLPYLIKDLISHIVDSIMSHRRGSGGYVAV